MALLEVGFYLLGATSVALVLASRWTPFLVYANAAVLLVMLYVQIAAIPLNLNWSRNLYGHLLRRLFVFVFFTAGIYAGHYYVAQAVPGSYLDSLYFSFTTWTTLGYGDITVVPRLRLATSIEALTGLLTTAVLTSMVWLYCQERMWPKSADQREELTLQLDDTLGGFREVESEAVIRQKQDRQRRLRVHPCTSCGNLSPSIEKFFDIVGRLAPLPNFVVMCSCGEHSKYSKSAYLAVHRWNRQHRPKATQRAGGPA